jgi:UDP-2,4-diacetamido-2,4,6-trideoxy-beta-L-altropyranose hydrolase
VTENPQLVIRADAGTAIGSGHIMRSLAIAQAWQAMGGTARFVCHDLPSTLSERLVEEDVLVEPVTADSGSADDAQHLLATANKHCAAAVVVDGYHFGQRYQDIIAEYSGTTLTIDDYGHLSDYRTSIVLNQNAGASEALYRSRSNHTRLLLGPQFALVRRELHTASGRDRRRDGTVKTILVTLGGSDPDNVTETVIRALQRLGEQDFRFRIIVGGLNDQLERLSALVKDDARFEFLCDVRDMASQYTWADLAIAAGGSSNWEMCCFGLPRLILVIAENQQSVASELARAGAAFNLGDASSVTVEQLANELQQLVPDVMRIQDCGESARRLVDGQGAVRCAQELVRPGTTGSSTVENRPPDGSDSELVLRDVTNDDWQLLLDWRNDPTSRSASRNSEAIEPTAHREWLSRCLANDCSTLLIAELNGIPAGTVRIDSGPVSELSWTVAPEARGKGLGSRMVSQVVRTSRVPLRAVTRSDNLASQRIARAAGFVFDHSDGDWMTFLRIPSQAGRQS